MPLINLIQQLGNIPITTFIPYFISFIVLSIGSYTDIKTREVPDWVNFGLIGSGLGISLLFSIIYLNPNFIISSILGFTIFFIIAWIMFYTGQWGGGDSKILMGLGAMIGIDIFSKNYFLGSFLINALIIGALYGILWSIISIFKNKKKFIKNLNKYRKNKITKIINRVILAISLIFVIFAVLTPDIFIKIISFYIAIISIITFYLWIVIKSVENSSMLKYVNPSKLTEGDWIAKEIKVDGKYITGPKDLGIEKKQIKKLISLYKKNKIKKIQIKEGIPFVPSFLIAFVITVIWGNLIFLII